MEFEDWEPFYDEIRDDFGYSREEDAESARLLDGRLQRSRGFDLGRLERVLGGEDVVVAGNAPSLDAADTRDEVVISADAACERLLEDGVVSDVVCTDLDGAPSTAAELSHEGTVVVVHAHGDNAGLVEDWIGEFDLGNVVGTTQTRPFGVLHNFGGFTDGDRAAFLADEFGARSVRLVGFDFEEATGEKARKLVWARRLLEYLGEKRGEELV